MKVVGNTEKDSNALHISKVFHKKSKDEPSQNEEKPEEDENSDSMKVPKVSKVDIEKVGSMKVMDKLANNDEKSMKIPGLRPHDKKTENAEDETVKGLKVKDKKVEKADKKSFRIAKVAHKKPKASGKVLPTLIFFFTLEEIFLFHLCILVDLAQLFINIFF